MCAISSLFRYISTIRAQKIWLTNYQTIQSFHSSQEWRCTRKADLNNAHVWGFASSQPYLHRCAPHCFYGQRSIIILFFSRCFRGHIVSITAVRTRCRADLAFLTACRSHLNSKEYNRICSLYGQYEFVHRFLRTMPKEPRTRAGHNQFRETCLSSALTSSSSGR